MNIPFYKLLNASTLPKGMLESITRGYRSLFESDAQKHNIVITPVGVEPNKQGGVYVVDIKDKENNGNDVNIKAMPYRTLKEMMEREGIDANGAKNRIRNNFYKQLLDNSNGTNAHNIFSQDDTTLNRLVKLEFKRLGGADITSSDGNSAQEENGASKDVHKETPTKEEKTSKQSADCKLPSLEDLDETAGTEDLPDVNSISLDDTKTMYVVSTPMGKIHVRFLNYTFPGLKKHAMKNNMEITDILYKKYLAILKSMMKSMSDERAKAVWAWMMNQNDTINSLAKIELTRIKNRWNIWREQVQEAKEKCAEPAAGPKITEVDESNSGKAAADASKQPETPKKQEAPKSDTSCVMFDPNNVPGDQHKYNPKFGYGGKTFHVIGEGNDWNVGWGHKGCRTMEALVERYTQRIKSAVPNIPEGDAKRCAIIVAQKLAKPLGISCDGAASPVRQVKGAARKANTQAGKAGKQAVEAGKQAVEAGKQVTQLTGEPDPASKVVAQGVKANLAISDKASSHQIDPDPEHAVSYTLSVHSEIPTVQRLLGLNGNNYTINPNELKQAGNVNLDSIKDDLKNYKTISTDRKKRKELLTKIAAGAASKAFTLNDVEKAAQAVLSADQDKFKANAAGKQQEHVMRELYRHRTIGSAIKLDEVKSIANKAIDAYTEWEKTYDAGNYSDSKKVSDNMAAAKKAIADYKAMVNKPVDQIGHDAFNLKVGALCSAVSNLGIIAERCRK